MRQPSPLPAVDLADLIIKWDLLHDADGNTEGPVQVDRKLWDEWVRLAWAVVNGGGQ